MFDRIHLYKLADAYSLFYSECLELAGQLTAYLRIGDGYVLADKVDDLAEHFLNGMIKDKSLQSKDKIIVMAMSYEILASENEKLRNISALEKSRIAMQCFVLGSMTVDKREAIQFLHKNGYVLKKEVKGISRDLVNNILTGGDLPKLDDPPSRVEVQPKEKRRVREKITQGTAAKIIRVSTATIKKWESGKGTPNGYPGRSDMTLLSVFSEQYNAHKAVNREGRAMCRPITGYKIEDIADMEDD